MQPVYTYTQRQKYDPILPYDKIPEYVTFFKFLKAGMTVKVFLHKISNEAVSSAPLQILFAARSDLNHSYSRAALLGKHLIPFWPRDIICVCVTGTS